MIMLNKEITNGFFLIRTFHYNIDVKISKSTMYSLSTEICTDSKIYNPGNSKNLDKLRKILDLINA